MTLNWWYFPGPSSFVNDVADELRSGCNTVLLLPLGMHRYLGRAIEQSLGDTFSWRSITFSRCAQPIDQLYERFAPDAPPGELRNVSNLIQHRSFQELVIWITDMELETWKPFREFLLEYEEVCRSVENTLRTLFCVAIRGENTLHTIKDEVCLKSIVWRNRLTRHDLFLYAGLHHTPQKTEVVLRELLIRLTASLALWDCETAGELAALEAECLFSPQTILKNMAYERGWVHLRDADFEKLWLNGAADQINGKWLKHSAIYGMADPQRVLEKRLWEAEVEVLLPWVEEFRRVYIERFSHRFNLPHCFKDKIIRDPRDVEIGHISHVTNFNRFTESKERDALFHLKDIRNNLSHLDIVTLPQIKQTLNATSCLRDYLAPI